MKNPTAPFSIGLGLVLVLGVLLASIIAFPAGPAQSREPDKTLKLYFGNTGERGEFTFKRNGRYDRGEIRRINKFLRDWRKNEPARMDPELLDLVWAIYKESGSRGYIQVVSAYRSPATNEMLRARSRGVAKNSQHRLGKAIDFAIPDVPLAKLRGIAMKMQGGGVGYYPRSGYPFVHVDIGNVRAWPRMSRQQLLALFPNGNTLHLPADGKPLPGYELAVATRKQSGSTPVLAYLDTGPTEAEEADRTGTEGGSAAGWLKRVFPGDSQEGEDIALAGPAAPSATAEPQQLVSSGVDSEAAPLPRSRPPSGLDIPSVDLAAETIVASADADTNSSLAVPQLPRTRPDAASLADSLGQSDVEVASLDVDSEDAIASLAARLTEEPAASDPSDAISLAFAAAEEPVLPSRADRAILAVFASVEESSAIREADATLVAAVIRRAAGEDRPAEQSQSLALAYAGSELLQLATIQPVATESVVAAGSGIVLPPDDAADYGNDEPSLVSLIETKIEAPAAEGELAMPTPESDLYRAPEAASEVADLHGVSGPPVDRYARGGETPDEDGFFSRLFASLIE